MPLAQQSEIQSATSLAPDEQQHPTQSSSVQAESQKTVYIKALDLLVASGDADGSLDSIFDISMHTAMDEKKFLALDDKTLETVSRMMDLGEEWTEKRDEDTPRFNLKQRPNHVDVFEDYMASFVEALKKEVPQDSKVAIVEDDEIERLGLREIACEEIRPYRRRLDREAQESSSDNESGLDDDFTSQS